MILDAIAGPTPGSMSSWAELALLMSMSLMIPEEMGAFATDYVELDGADSTRADWAGIADPKAISRSRVRFHENTNPPSDAIPSTHAAKIAAGDDDQSLLELCESR